MSLRSYTEDATTDTADTADTADAAAADANTADAAAADADVADATWHHLQLVVGDCVSNSLYEHDSVSPLHALDLCW